MSEDDLLLHQIFAECPVKILPNLHGLGWYIHFQGHRGVMCYHKDEAWQVNAPPTDLQQRWWNKYPRKDEEPPLAPAKAG